MAIKSVDSAHGYSSLLNNLKIQVEENWHKVNLLITSMHIEDIQPLLNYYSKKDAKKINQIEAFIKEVNLLKNHLNYLAQQVDLVAKDNDQARKIKHLIQHIKHQICIANHQLNIAEWFCKTYLNRLLKNIHTAKTAVTQWISEINLYKKYMQENKLSYPVSLLNLYLVNAYNHQAKIYRALAGKSLNNLDDQQLQFSSDSYHEALNIVCHPVILNGLGFLYSDMSSQATCHNRNDLLSQSLAYHEAALAMDSQDPNTYHGIGCTLYKIEKQRHDTSNVIINENLDRALSAFTFAQQTNSNGRLFLDKALVYLLLNNDEKVLENLNQGLIIDPNHVLLLYQRGCFFLSKQHLITALQDLRLGRTISVDCQDYKDLFDKAIKEATANLSLEYKTPLPAVTLDDLDIRKIAKQQAFEDALRNCAHYAKLLHPDHAKPSIFISYAWANAEHVHFQKQLIHEESVKQLAKELEIAGFNVLFDRWYDIKGNNISDFIEKIFDGFALVIGTNHYLEKYKKLSEQDKADPVLQTEVYFISHLLRYTKKTRDKIIPLLLEGTVEESLPKILYAKTPVDLVKNDRFSEIFKLVCAMHQFPLRDEKVTKIISRFETIRKEIDGQAPKELAKIYESSINTLFQQRSHDSRKAQELIVKASSLRAKL